MRISKYAVLILILVVFFLTINSEAKSIIEDEHSSDAIYGLGLIGAAIYYLSNAKGFWKGVLGFLKAILWPMFLVYDLLKFMKSE